MTADACHLCKLYTARDDYRRLWDGLSPVAKPAPRTHCLHLGPRVEFRPACCVRTSRHECLAGEPQAVPGGVCQTCPKWEADQ